MISQPHEPSPHPSLRCAIAVGRPRWRAPGTLLALTAALAIIDVRLASGHRTGVLWALDACATLIWGCATAVLMRRARRLRAARSTHHEPADGARAAHGSHAAWTVTGKRDRDAASRPSLARRRRDAHH